MPSSGTLMLFYLSPVCQPFTVHSYSSVAEKSQVHKMSLDPPFILLNWDDQDTPYLGNEQFLSYQMPGLVFISF